MNGPSPAEAVRDVTSDGVDRTIEVSLSENIDLDAAVVSEGAVIAAYASQVARLNASFWPLLFTNVTLRMMGSDDLPSAAQQLASKVSPTRPPRTPLTSLSQTAIRSSTSLTVTTVLMLAHEGESFLVIPQS